MRDLRYLLLFIFIGLVFFTNPLFAEDSPKACFDIRLGEKTLDRKVPTLVNKLKDSNLNLKLDSHCSEGEIVKFQWEISHYEGRPEGRKIDFSFDKLGSYFISLTVTDENAKTDSHQRILKIGELCAEIVDAPKKLFPPMAKPITVNTCATPDSISEYSWIVEPTAPDCEEYKPSFGGNIVEVSAIKPLPEGESCAFTATLTVIDTNGLSVSSEPILVAIPGPVAVITPIPSSVQISESIPLDGSPSYTSVDASITEYNWTVCGEQKEGKMIEVTIEKPGECTITLTVKDSNGNSGATSQTTKVIIPPPVAVIVPDPIPSTIVASETLTLDGRGSYTSVGSITEYNWTVCGDEKEGETIEVTFDKAGECIITLTVIDSNGYSDSTSQTTKVITPPIAVAQVLHIEIKIEVEHAEYKVKLDGSASSGNITRYKWTATNNDGSYSPVEKTENGKPTTMTIALPSEGTYTIKLEVFDDDNNLNGFDQLENVLVKNTISISPQEESFSLPERFVTLSTSMGQRRLDQRTLRQTAKRRVLRKGDYWPKRVRVKFYENTSEEEKDFLRKSHNASSIKAIPFINGELWEVEEVEAAIETYRRRVSTEPKIKSMTPDYVIRASELRARNKILIESFLRNHSDGHDDPVSIETKEPVVCAVLDSGIDYKHSALKDKILTEDGKVVGYDFVDDDDDPMDDCGHGTHVAGIIAGVANEYDNSNVTTTNGIWPVKLIPLKILRRSDTPNEFGKYECIGSQTDAILALEYVQNHAEEYSIKCTNNSWDVNYMDDDLDSAIKAEAEAGRLFVFAAGNAHYNGPENNDVFSPYYPGSLTYSENDNIIQDNIISVCSVNSNHILSHFSNYGQQSIDLCALGDDIRSTYPNGEYIKDSGTSMAAPYVTATVMVLWSAYPYLTMSEVKTHILASTKQIQALADYNVTSGYLSLYDAVKNMKSRHETFTISNTGKDNLVNVQVTLMNKEGDELNCNGKLAILKKIRDNNCSSKTIETIIPDQKYPVEVFFTPKAPSVSTSKVKKEWLLKVTSTNQTVNQTIVVLLNGNAGTGSSGGGDSGDDDGDDDTPPSNSPQWADASICYPDKDYAVEIPKVTMLEDYKDVGETAKFSLKFSLILDNMNSPHFCFNGEPSDLLLESENIRELGQATFNDVTNILNIPFLKVEGMENFYEVDLKAGTDNCEHFELILVPNENPVINRFRLE